MRTLFGLGLLAATGLLITTVVYGQVTQGVDVNSNRYPSVNTTGVGSHNELLLLADAADPFSVARKTQDTNYGAPNSTNSSSDNYRTANTSAPLFSGAASNSQPDSTTPSNEIKQPSGPDSGTQAIFPSATGSASQNPSAKTSSTGDSSDATTSGPLKSLQQRLSAVRKSTTPGMASASDVHSSMVENPNTPTLAPTMAPTVASTIAVSTPAPMPPKAIAAAEGPMSPNMPDIRSTQFSPGVEEGYAGITASNRTSYPVVSVTVAPTAPVVSEPIHLSRRDSSAAVSSDLNTSSDQDNASRSPAPAHMAALSSENVLFSHQSPILRVETTGPRSISVGKEANYCVTITNAGETAAQNVEVSIKTPEWSEVLRTKATNGETVEASDRRGEPLIWRLPRLESHAKEQLNVRLVPRESRSFDLAVQWTCSPAMSQAMVEVKEPKIVLSVNGPPEILFGQTKIYRLTLANPGNGDAENVELLLAPVDGGAGAPTRQEIGLIRAGESKPVEVELYARQAGKLSIKAMAVADGNLKAEVAEDILVRRAGLKAAVNGPNLKFAGKPVNYNIVIANPGNSTSENISVSTILPPGAKFVSSPGGQFVEDESKVSWNIPSLRAGAEQELQLTCTLNTPGANRIQVLATAAGDLNDNISTVTDVEALADLKLEVTDPPGPLAVGEEMVYEVHIHNRGTKAAENVDVAGFFSNGIEAISTQGELSEISPGQIVFKPIGLVPAGSEVVLKIRARADQPGNHVFRTEVNCPSVGAKLAAEETTLFYGDGRVAEERVAARPTAPMGTQAIPPSDSSAPAVPR